MFSSPLYFAEQILSSTQRRKRNQTQIKKQYEEAEKKSTENKLERINAGRNRN